MSKRKMHRFYLSIIRAIITFAPFIYLFISLSIQMFSFGDNGFSWSTDLANIGLDSGNWINTFASQLEVFISRSGYFSGLVNTLMNLFSYFISDVLGLLVSRPLGHFIQVTCVWFILAQLIYFVMWIFDFVIDFVMDIGERFINRGNK